MNLELKHLASYLPYGLNLMFEKSGRIINMQSCYNEGSLHITDSNEGNTYNLSNWNFKPILRPLSQLTGIIEYNGEKFVPIEELSELIDDRGMGYNDHYINYSSDKNFQQYWLNEPYFIFEKLLEWHFDVFNLIETDFAIAVTDELNPYK